MSEAASSGEFPHSRYQPMPDLTADEYDALRADIKTNGVLVPVEVDEDGNILRDQSRDTSHTVQIPMID